MSRNYRAEYQRRLARAAARGLSRSQARGHAKVGEASIRPKAARTAVAPDPKLEYALRLLRTSGKQAVAAKEAGVSVERFRRYLRAHNLAHREGRVWKITDERDRQILVITTLGERTLLLRGAESASLAARHSSAVARFLDTQDISLLEPFRAGGVTDVRGQRFEFETDPNRLYRLAAGGMESFEEIYRIVA